MIYLNWRVCAGLAKIRSAKETCVFSQIIIQLSCIPVDCFYSVGYIPGFAVFVQCRGSNAINIEHLIKMFRPMFSICSLLKVKLRRCILMCVTNLLYRIQCNVSKRATLLLSKLHAWIDKLDGCRMLSVNKFLKISFTFPTEKMRIAGIDNTKDLNV